MSNDLKHTADLDAVDAYLAECLRHALAAEPWPVWPGHWTYPEQEQTVVKRCQFHGIANVLAATNRAFEGWPKAVREPLLFESRLAAVWEDSHKKALSSLLQRLADAAVAVTVMKGTALAYLSYDLPSMRRRGDTDILIGPQDLERTRSILESAGFSAHNNPHGLYYQETWRQKVGHHLQHVIDLHWQPTDRPVLQRILRFDDFVQNRVPLTRLSRGACAPSPVQMLIQGAINQAWHTARGYNVANERILGGRRLIWQVDYAMLVRRFNENHWDELLRVCRARDARSIVYSALAGAQKDLDLQIPERVMTSLRQRPERSPSHTYIMTPESALTKLRDINVAGSMGLRFKIIRMAVLAPRDHLVAKYPNLHHWPTFALHLRRFADSAARLFRQWSAK